MKFLSNEGGRLIVTRWRRALEGPSKHITMIGLNSKEIACFPSEELDKTVN
jgi:hypothetical protein